VLSSSASERTDRGYVGGDTKPHRPVLSDNAHKDWCQVCGLKFGDKLHTCLPPAPTPESAQVLLHEGTAPPKRPLPRATVDANPFNGLGDYIAGLGR
jgi:hypothetical protein